MFKPSKMTKREEKSTDRTMNVYTDESNWPRFLLLQSDSFDSFFLFTPFRPTPPIFAKARFILVNGVNRTCSEQLKIRKKY